MLAKPSSPAISLPRALALLRQVGHLARDQSGPIHHSFYTKLGGGQYESPAADGKEISAAVSSTQPFVGSPIKRPYFGARGQRSAMPLLGELTVPETPCLFSDSGRRANSGGKGCRRARSNEGILTRRSALLHWILLPHQFYV